MKHILVQGHRHFVDMLLPLLSSEEIHFAEAREWRRNFQSFLEVIQADALYFLGGSIRPSCLYPLVRLLHIPVIKHWVGSDVLEAREDLKHKRVSHFAIHVCVHWAVAPWLVDELGTLGIQAQLVPLSSTIFPAGIPPLPEQFTVLAYLPEQRADFYGKAEIVRLAQDLPEVRFLVLSSSSASSWVRQELLPKNILLLGNPEDIRPVYAQSSVLVRMTRHDGLSFMVLEALAYGRRVIWNHPLGNVIAVDNYGQLIDKVKDLWRQHQAGKLMLDEQGAAWVRNTFDPSALAQELRRNMETVWKKKPQKF